VFLDANEPTPCAVSIDIYGEEFNLQASRDEARSLIKTSSASTPPAGTSPG
jgi:hypothetical protein